MDTKIEIASNALALEQNRLETSRKISLWSGGLYLLTFISIPTVSLYSAIHQPDYITSIVTNNHVIVGCILEIIVALAGIGTAIILFPVLKTQNEGMAIGLIVSRGLEASTMFTGVAFLLTVVTLQQNHAGMPALPVSNALVSLYDRMFLLGQSFMPGINDLLLGLLFYKSRLVPRFLAVIGIAGALPLIAGYLAMMFGLIGQHSLLAGLAALLVALFEFSLGLYLLLKGFKPAIRF